MADKLIREWPSRAFAGLAGLWLVMFGAVTFQMLRNLTDNAYLWLLILVLLAPVGLLFLIAAALPVPPRVWIWYIGAGLLWLVGGFGIALLGLALVIIPSQSYRTQEPFLWYLLGFVLLALTLYFVGFRPLRDRQRGNMHQ